MASQQTPEQPNKSQSCFTKIVFAVGGLIAIFVVLAIFGSQAQNNGRRALVSTSSFSTITPAPVATLTFGQWENKAESISYDTLARLTSQYKGRLISFRGRVALVPMATDDYVELWVYVSRNKVTGSWNKNKMVLIYRDPPIRVLEEDMISFVGEVDGVGSDQAPKLQIVALEIE